MVIIILLASPEKVGYHDVSWDKLLFRCVYSLPEFL